MLCSYIHCYLYNIILLCSFVILNSSLLDDRHEYSQWLSTGTLDCNIRYVHYDVHQLANHCIAIDIASICMHFIVFLDYVYS